MLIQEKAKKVADSLCLNDFKASNGWLFRYFYMFYPRFCKRHSISCKTLSGESAEMNQEVVNNWIEGLKVTLERYPLEDVFNCDETGLFWKGLPNRTLVVQEDKSKGGKLAKERVTVLLCCSASGEKLKPLVIGRSQMPRCFNGKLPANVIWKANKNIII